MTSSGSSSGGGGGRAAIIPAIIAAVATIVAAIVAAIIQTSRPPLPHISAVPSSTPSPSGGTPTTATAVPPGMLWHQEVRFPDYTGLDLADGKDPVRQGWDFFMSTGTFAGGPVPAFTARQQAGKVEKSSATLSDCRTALSSAPQQGQIYGNIGDSFCVESKDGTRLAAVSVRRREGNSWVTDAQVWQL